MGGLPAILAASSSQSREKPALPALQRGGYAYESQINVGKRIGGGKHVVDVVAEKGEHRYLISLKWQQTSGTAEQKVPFEVTCLVEAVLGSKGHFEKAYLVLGGEGWSLREFYTTGGLKKHLEYAEKVEILTLEAFIAKANRGEL